MNAEGKTKSIVTHFKILQDLPLGGTKEKVPPSPQYVSRWAKLLERMGWGAYQHYFFFCWLYRGCRDMRSDAGFPTLHHIHMDHNDSLVWL